MLIQICAQTRHSLTAIQVANWLKCSKQKLNVKGLDIYNYLVQGKPGTEPTPGFWWVATIENENLQVTDNGSLRVFGSTYSGTGKFFTVKRLFPFEWPSPECFDFDANIEDIKGLPLVDRIGTQMCQPPYSYADIYEHIRQKKPSKKINTNDFELLDSLEEQLATIQITIKQLRASMI